MREAFQHELVGIRDLLIEMAVKAGAAMNTATHAMLNADLGEAQAVIDGDDALDDLTGRIEWACYDAVARQQPVARDLRLVVSSLQISSSLERMGDLADHVAKLTRMRHPQASIPEDVRPMLAQMGAVADRMATRAASLLKSADLAEATEILAMDDQMDQIHRDLFTAVLAPTWTHGVKAAIDTTLMSRYYERYADHSVAVARRVIQMVTGESFSQTDAADQAAAPATHSAPASGPTGS
ncbi:MAG: phosphate signaling complex protein PhoU [Candidatus Nanopelagicales bacterium]